MRILNVDSHDYLKVAVEELEALSTELSGEVLIEAPDVQEDLVGELDTLEGVRNDIAENGMTRDAARKLDAAVEGFLIRNHISTFTTTPSIEGLATALEAADEQRGNALQRLIAWFSEKITKMIDWIKSLFEKEGKVEKTAATTKAMAEECEQERNTEEMARMAKDAKAAAQSVRIDPSEEKSGTFEEFVDALEKNMEPVKEDINRMYARLNSSKVMRTLANNPDSVKSFFDHMETTSAQITGVRQVVDDLAKKIANATNAQQTLGDVKMARGLLYRQLGGSGPDVLDSIRQTQFTANEENQVTIDTVPYDKLITAICQATRHIGAANAGTRIKELEYLKKAVEQLGKMEYSSVNKLSPQDRDVVLSAAKGLVDDVTKYISADMDNWNCTLGIYSGVSAFFNSERAIYFRVIGAIQRAATSVFAEADRTTLYEDFKKKGFNLDISQEELQRRGVGMESFHDCDLTLPALESSDVEHPGNFPTEPIFVGRGLMAALESEEVAGEKVSIGRRIIEWFKRMVEHIKSLFTKRSSQLSSVVEKAKERRKQQAEANFGHEQSDPASLKVWQKYAKDSAWWKSQLADEVESKVSSNFAIALLLNETSLKTCLSAIDGMLHAFRDVVREVESAKSIQDFIVLANTGSLSKFTNAKEELVAASAKVHDGKFADLEEAISAVRSAQAYIAPSAKQAAVIDETVKQAETMMDKAQSFFDKNEEAIKESAEARQVIKAIGEMPRDIMSMLTTVATVHSHILVGDPLNRAAIVEKMSAAEVEAGNPALSAQQRAHIIASSMWWDLKSANESHESMVFARQVSFALESFEEAAPDIWGITLGLSAGLEDEEATKVTFRARMKAVLQRIIEWFRNLFSKKKKEGENRLDELREKVKKQREEAMKAPKEVLRPDALKIFDKYYSDTAWFAKSKCAQMQATAIERSGVSFMYSGMTYQQFHAMADTDMKAAYDFIKKVSNASSFAQLPEAPNGPVPSNISNVKTGSVKFQSIKESAEAMMAWCKNAQSLKALHDNLGGVETLANEATKRLLKISDESSGDQAQVKKIQAVSAALVSHVRNVTTFAGYAMAAAMECVMPAALHRRAIITEMFEHYKESNPDSDFNLVETDLRLLSNDRRWYVDVNI